uniref:Sulfiredoxin-1 n=1 Tax=Phallusia mammillata TaxID=59560 RepID=A0A6F9DTU7_9ASCI|nr:sulfiredoxin-1-like [Phallusia mammillata]
MWKIVCSVLFSRTNLRASITRATPAVNMATYNEGDIVSIHSDHISEVHTMPIKHLIRPFPSELSEEKVLSLMETIQDEKLRHNVPPIDVMWVKGRNGGDYYYSFGGCHRYEAHMRLKKDFIDVKLVKSTVESLRPYLGAATPDLR